MPFDGAGEEEAVGGAIHLVPQRLGCQLADEVFLTPGTRQDDSFAVEQRPDPSFGQGRTGQGTAEDAAPQVGRQDVTNLSIAYHGNDDRDERLHSPDLAK